MRLFYSHLVSIFIFVCTSLCLPLWAQADTVRSAPMNGVWATTSKPFTATLTLRNDPTRPQQVAHHGGRKPAFNALVLTLDRPDDHSALSRPFLALTQGLVFSLVDTGLDACDITYYRAIAKTPNGQHLKLVLADRRPVVRLDCLARITKNQPAWSASISAIRETDDYQTVSTEPLIARLEGEPDGDADVADWRDTRFHDAWVGLITQNRNPITGHTHYAFAPVSTPTPYILDRDNALLAFQYCGDQFIDAVLQRAGTAPLFDRGEFRQMAYWRIVQCRDR